MILLASWGVILEKLLGPIVGPSQTILVIHPPNKRISYFNAQENEHVHSNKDSNKDVIKIIG